MRVQRNGALEFFRNGIPVVQYVSDLASDKPELDGVGELVKTLSVEVESLDSALREFREALAKDGLPS